jgi:hypothetical protein
MLVVVMLNGVLGTKLTGEETGVNPLTATVTGPAAAPAGASATTLAGVHDVTVAGVPANATVPFTVPKPDPEMVTAVPDGPEVGESAVMAGGVAVKFAVSLTALLIVTVSGLELLPVVPLKPEKL